jgi:protein-S-isoprenylcysteine O-methyltransferase Ste14
MNAATGPRQGATVAPRWLAACVTDAILAAAWTFFAYRAYLHWRLAGSVAMLLVFAVNSLFALLFVLRRRDATVSDDPRHWAATAITVLLSFCFRGGSAPVWLARATEAGQVVGLVIVLFALGSLGRSFGLVPANRGVKVAGLYRLVRHPLYAGELIVYAFFLAGNFGLTNALVLSGIVCGLCYRAITEEKFLAQCEDYQRYLYSVRHRFIPGIY